MSSATKTLKVRVKDKHVPLLLQMAETRNDALAIGATHYFSGKQCKKGHVAPRIASNGSCTECMAEWRLNNKETSLKHSRDYYAKRSKDVNIKASKARRLVYEKSPWIMLIRWSKVKAKKRGIAFELTNEWGANNWNGTCALTGLPFLTPQEHGLTHAHPMSPSIDRIDSEVGYTPNNCRFILHCVNVFRSTLGDSEMLRVSKLLSDNCRLAGGIPCH